ncbi:MAG: hypothetical protein K0S80_5164 [Neobacillus sp.]|nr:hypothetical protein [Neobacillus sp.]
MYKIYIRDANFRRVGETRELIKNKAGIIVKKDGLPLFSGTITSRKRSFSSNSDIIAFAGKDDNNYLAARLAYPVPSADFSLSDYDVRTGPAETIMKQYVDINAGPNAPITGRRIFSIEADAGLGSIVTGRARFDKLIDLLSSLALSGGGLGFRVVQVGVQLQFQVYQPQDKTRSAFFSPLLGNLSSFEYSNDDPEANMVIVGGGGEGTSRIIRWKQDSESIVDYSRFETFVDQRNTSDEAELNQVLDEELTNKSAKNSFNFIPIDTPQLAFNRDYRLGDKVSIILTQPNEIVEKETLHYFLSFYQTGMIETERIRKIQEKLAVIQDVVREVKITIDSNGETISPVVGNDDSHAKGIIGIFDKVRKITKRLSNLERV